MDRLLITVSRELPDGTVEAVALSADPAVVRATVEALERAMRGPAPRRHRALTLAPDGERPPGATRAAEDIP